ncbi:MAG: GntR family transcriptional regulator [Acidaminococcus sp.]|jgi:DNA-binding GntR family transcriptional regulator|nr:GntR family transcriptional regulator [Acidaminococcus sp.]MCI2116000.1 GntR family transcriptional regulator [Acidaminococcus sp.]
MDRQSAKRPPAQEQIAEAIKARIKSGELAPGTELKQVELAEFYGVSRMPVREALNKLLTEGVVEKMNNRHIVVAGSLNKNQAGREKNKENAALPRVHLLPARERVAAYLRRAILRQEIKEGTVLTLEGTARQMGVSSMPVREALQMLASQGLVLLRPNKGAVVLGMTEKNIRDHYAVRALLESEAAALAARPGTDISGIEQVYAEMKQILAEKRFPEYKRYNESFHMAIWEAADNPKLEQLLAGMWNGLSLGYLVSEQEYAMVSSREHEGIMEAIREHNSEKARKLMKAHMVRSMNDLLTNYKGLKK